MSVSYRITPSHGDMIVEVEPNLESEETPRASLTVTDDLNPGGIAFLNLEEIAELREVLEKVADALSQADA